jgi:outer membrane protein assembly factor BamB
MVMHTSARVISVAALLAVALPGAVPAMADWPNFRGPQYDGISTETGFKTDCASSIPRKWERELGPAFSSFAAVGDRVYTCGTAGKKQILYCLDAETGDVLWDKPIEEAYDDSNGSGTRATPTVHDGHVYILGAHGRLLCANAEEGKTVWSRNFNHKPQWGYSGSVLIENNLAIVSAGKDDGALAAFNRTSGDLVWKSGDDAAGYSTPYPFTFDKERYIVGFMADSAIIVRARDGKIVWRLPWKTSWNVNAASPLYHNRHLFLTSGYNTGCALLRLKPDKDVLTSETVWRSKVLLNKFQSCILHEGNLYSCDQNAFKCVDFMTGEERWEKKGLKHGTVILADNHLLILTQEGQLQIGEVSPTDFAPTTAAQVLDGRCWTVPVLHRGRLYARNLERAVCVDLRP